MDRMKRQRLLGFALIGICVMIVVLACQGSTPEERDITPVALLLPLGIYTLTTKKYILTDMDAGITEEDREHDVEGGQHEPAKSL